MQANVEGGAHAVAPPRRSWITVATPILVLASTIGIVVWSAWPTLRQARTVRVTQAVFDRTDAPPTGPDTPEQATRGGARTVQAAGWLEGEPFYVAATALADGIVESVEVLEGDPVRRGDVIARLVDEDAELRLARASAELEAAQADLLLAEAELRAAQTDWDEPIERTRAVDVGRAALAESEAELAQLPSQIGVERATLIQLEEELARAEEAQAGGAATDIEVIVAKQRAEAQRAMLEATEARRPVLRARTERLRAELVAAERNLELRVGERLRLDAAEAGVVRAQAAAARAEAARDEARLELDRMVIRAPIDGYIQNRLKVPGDKAVRMMDSPHSAHLAHLYDPAHIQVRVDVPLADASEVYVGQPCEVVVEVLPDELFRGEVLRVTHEADLQKNTLQVKVRVLDPSPLLRPEMLTRVKFLPRQGGTGSDATEGQQTSARALAPRDAVETRTGSARVWAVRDRSGNRGVVRAVPVMVLGEVNGWLRVEGDINPGELLVVGDDGLAAGERVRIDSLGKDGGS